MPSLARAVTVGLVAAGAAIAGLVVASWMFEGRTAGTGPRANLVSGTLLPQARALPDFKLTDQDGKAFDRGRLAGHWSAIFVGFTHCPDVCPTTLGLLKAVRGQLDAQKRPLQVVFLSIDPERDTPDVLGHYVHYFDPSFVGITGPNAELDRLGAAMGFVYAKMPGPTPGTYSMDHSALLIVVNPDAKVQAYLSPPFKVDALVTDLGQLVPAAG